MPGEPPSPTSPSGDAPPPDPRSPDPGQALDPVCAGESYYRRLFNNAVLGIFQTTPAGQVLFVNPAFAQMFGFESPEYLLRSIHDAATGFYVDPTRRAEIVREILDGPGWGKFEVQYRRRDGTPFTGILHIWGARDEGGPVSRFEGFVEDVSERKRAEEALRESQRRLQDIIDFLPDATFAIDTEGRVTAWNRAIEKMTGVKATDILGKGDHEYAMAYYGERRRVLIDLVLEPLDEARLHYTSVQREGDVLIAEGYAPHLGPGGRWFEASAAPLRNAAGKVVGAIEIERDTTARRRAQEELRDSQRRLADIIEFLPDATLVIDSQGRVTAWNRAIEVMTGVPASNMVGKGDFEYALPFYGERRPILADLVMQPLDEVEARYTHLRRQGDTLTGEGRITNLGKEDLFFVGNAAALRDASGNIAGAIETIRDVTERKQVEDALRESEERFRAIYEGSNDAIMLLDEQGFFDCNQQTLQMFRLASKDAFTSLHPGDISPPLQPDGQSSRAAAVERIRAAYHHGHDRFEWLHRRADGEVFPAEVLLSAFDLEGKKVVQATVRDITERKHAEQAIRDSEARLRTITDTVRDAIIVVDDSGAISYWNPAAEAVFGYPASEALGQDLHLLLAPERYRDAYQRGFSAFRQTGSGPAVGKTLELEARRRDGSEFAVEISLSAIKLRDAWHAIAVLRDISARKNVERELQAAKETAESASRAKSAFLANMSHEIRTPMNAILGFAQLLRQNPDLKPELYEHVDIIARSGEHLLALINDILEMSKIEAGQTTCHAATCDLQALFNDVGLMFGLRARSKGLRFDVDRAPDAPRYVRTDESKLRQVLINLLGNAVKFTDAGGIALRLGCKRDDQAGVRLVVEVEDTGPGIREEERDKLFKPFEQTRAGLAARGGTGLGLAISHEFVKLLGGELQVRSWPGLGSVFSFEIPAHETEAPDGGEATSIRRVIGLGAGTRPPRLLVVDDKETNRRLLVAMLTPLGFEIAEAADGAQALAAFTERQPDLVLMDLVMPVMDGYEAMRRLRAMQEGRDTPIVAVTASAFEEDRQRVLDSGADDYLRKPLQQHELLDKLRSLLHLRYIYSDETALPGTAGAESMTSLARAMAAVPAAVRLRLRDAARSADMAELLALIAQIGVTDEITAVALKRLASAYDYERIAEACEAGGAA